MTSAYESGAIPPIQVHHRLRIAREWADLEQGELAQRIGISRTSVSSAEKGKTHPRRITLNAWALATGVPVTWIMTGQAPPSDDDGNDGVRPKGFEPLTFWEGHGANVISANFKRAS